MKSLLIVANPSKTSFTHALAKGYTKNHQDCEIIDLYEIDQAMYAYESVSELKKGNDNADEKRTHIQEKISKAQEIVFFFPVWWGGMPAILKNFFDVNLSSGYAFQFEEGGKIKKLLTGKEAKIYCHCDAPGFIYKVPFILGINLKWYISRAILGFCGIKTVDFKLFDNISRKKTQEQRQEIIDSI